MAGEGARNVHTVLHRTAGVLASFTLIHVYTCEEGELVWQPSAIFCVAHLSSSSVPCRCQGGSREDSCTVYTGHKMDPHNPLGTLLGRQQEEGEVWLAIYLSMNSHLYRPGRLWQ